ncbi:CPBP family intramembrane glutamic endopeptidase [Halocatena halophila]|uniref:CPBP family intramembrane glutamic endopeptidase n=1 Tax=Halocatena halophila TaxID=2814576 RepID=UPI002ED60CBD
MPDWTTFFAIAGVVLVLLLVLARLSSGAVTDSTEREPIANESTAVLLANVAISQGLFATVLVIAVWITSIPPFALGVEFSSQASVGLTGLLTGITAGILLYLFNVAGSMVAKARDVDFDARLREQLTPDSHSAWVLLLVGVLPIIAVFEELLFRAILIGVTSVGTGLSPWLFAGGSSVVFAVGHGVQGRLGMLVTGVLGFALAVVFIISNSLLAVVVAHYLVNALEFLCTDRIERLLGRHTSAF